MKTLIDEKRLQARISEMAQEIDEYYLGQEWYKETQEPVVILCVLNGAIFSVVDLIRKLSIRTELDFVKISTYPCKSITAQKPKIILWPQRDIHDNEHILLVDDILDTGRTLGLIQDHILYECPISMKTAVLLRKPGKAPDTVTADFVGFDIPDKWVAGYGMDDRNGRNREIPYIFVDRR